MHIPADLTKTLALNFLLMHDWIAGHLKQWDCLVFTCMGCNSLIQIMVLLCLLHLLHSLPLVILTSYLRQVHSIFLTFCGWTRGPGWDTNPVQAEVCGGLELPDPLLYYKVAHLTTVVDWFCHAQQRLWVAFGAVGVPVVLGWSSLEFVPGVQKPLARELQSVVLTRVFHLWNGEGCKSLSQACHRTLIKFEKVLMGPNQSITLYLS